MAPQVGSVVAGRYRLIGLLGEGGMSSVYEAVHTGTAKRVAVKVLAGRLANDPEQLRRFELEAQASGVIRHAGIVDVFDVGRDENGVAYIVMEHLSGATLRQLERALQPMTPGQAVGLIAPALEALAAAHAAGVIHRDLKPANIFLAVQPTPVVKLLDFGISKFTSREEMTATGVVMGTVAYMAPEQLRSGRNVGPASDLYAMGAVLYALLASRPPHVAESDPELVVQIVTGEISPLSTHRPDLSPELCALVESMLAKDPASRPPSALAVRERLLALAPPDVSAAIEIAAKLAQPFTPIDLGSGSGPSGPESGGNTRTAVSPNTPERVMHSATPMPAGPGMVDPGMALQAPATGAPKKNRRKWYAVGLLLTLAVLSAAFTYELEDFKQDLTRWVLAQRDKQVRDNRRALEAQDEKTLLAKPLSRGPLPVAHFLPPGPSRAIERPVEWTEAALTDAGVLQLAHDSIDYARGQRAAGQEKEAGEYLDGLVQQMSAGNDPLTLGHALRVRADFALDLKHCAEADQLYRRAFRTFDTADDAPGAGMVAQDLGLLANVCRSNDREAWYAVALKRRLRTGDQAAIFKSANSLGQSRLLFGRFEEAIDAFTQALAAAEKLKDDNLQLKIHANLATTWARIGMRDVKFQGRWNAKNEPANEGWAKAQEQLGLAAAVARRAGVSVGSICDEASEADQSICRKLMEDVR
jgi:serine/threonine protein kinase/tetratricopeptide (TPR) repeat protein